MTTAHDPAAHPTPTPATGILLLIAWLWVGLPLAWGVNRTCQSAAKLFTANTPPTATIPTETRPLTH